VLRRVDSARVSGGIKTTWLVLSSRALRAWPRVCAAGHGPLRG